MKIDNLRKALEDEVSQGRVNRRTSEDGRYVIYNYAPNVQFDRSWNPVNRMARGIIFDAETGDLVARPFPKFHNLGEYPESDVRAMRLGRPQVSEKLDGSLGIIFLDHHDGQLRVSTRGSLDSEQASWATRWLRSPERKRMRDGLLSLLEKGLTPLVEIIYPENRIVVNYGEAETLRLLGLVRMSDGHVLPPSASRAAAESFGMEHPKDYSHMSFEELLQAKSEIGPGEEGWVLSWEDPESPHGQHMLKVKGEEYLKVHKLRFQLTFKAIYELMRDDKDIKAMIADLPDEFHKEVMGKVESIQEMFDGIRQEVKEMVSDLPEFEERRDAAIWAQRNLPRERMSMFFAHLDGREDKIEELIWKEVGKRLTELDEVRMFVRGVLISD